MRILTKISLAGIIAFLLSTESAIGQREESSLVLKENQGKQISKKISSWLGENVILLPVTTGPSLWCHLDFGNEPLYHMIEFYDKSRSKDVLLADKYAGKTGKVIDIFIDQYNNGYAVIILDGTKEKIRVPGRRLGFLSEYTFAQTLIGRTLIIKEEVSLGIADEYCMESDLRPRYNVQAGKEFTITKVEWGDDLQHIHLFGKIETGEELLFDGYDGYDCFVEKYNLFKDHPDRGNYSTRFKINNTFTDEFNFINKDNENVIDEIDLLSWDKNTLAVSLDNMHIAYRAKIGNRQYVVRDQVEGKHYDSITDTLIFSPDGMHLAYGASINNQWFVVLDEKPGKKYSSIIKNLSFSPDGERLAYGAKIGEKWCIVVDGEEGKFYDGIGPTCKFSPDGKQLSYFARIGDKWCIAVDGEEGKYYDGMSATYTFSPDGKRIAYCARTGEKWFVVVDGKEGKHFDGIGTGGPFFTPDGRRLAYFARKGEKWFAVVDGKEGKYYNAIGGARVFSPDGKRLVYCARTGNKWCVVIDGKEGKYYDDIGASSPFLSPDGKRLAYSARTGKKWLAVIDGKEGKQYDGIFTSNPFFSPDGKRFAYIAQIGNKWCIVVDGKEGKQYDDIIGKLAFSPNGKRLAYCGKIGEKYYIVVNGKEEKYYSGMLLRSNLTFDEFDNLRYLAVNGNKIYSGISENIIEETYDTYVSDLNKADNNTLKETENISTIKIEADDNIIELLNNWDKDIWFFTPSIKPIRSIRGLKASDLACWGAEHFNRMQELRKVLGIEDGGVNLLGDGAYKGKTNKPLLYVTWAKYAPDFKQAVRVEFVVKGAAKQAKESIKSSIKGSIKGVLLRDDTKKPFSEQGLLLMRFYDKDDKGNPFRIFLKDEKLPKATTNNKGQFEFNNLPEGNYSILLGDEYDDRNLNQDALITINGATLILKIDKSETQNMGNIYVKSDMKVYSAKESSKDIRPSYDEELEGSNTVRVRNPNNFNVAVGIRSGIKGKNFDVPANGVQTAYIPNGRYDIYFIYSDKPKALFQGDSFSLKNNGIEIQIVKIINGNYNIRQVK